MDVRLTWLSVMVLLMVSIASNFEFGPTFFYVPGVSSHSSEQSFSIYVAVTGLHDMDEFVQSQLILAVSLQFLITINVTSTFKFVVRF